MIINILNYFYIIIILNNFMLRKNNRIFFNLYKNIFHITFISFRSILHSSKQIKKIPLLLSFLFPSIQTIFFFYLISFYFCHFNLFLFFLLISTLFNFRSKHNVMKRSLFLAISFSLYMSKVIQLLLNKKNCTKILMACFDQSEKKKREINKW